MADTVGEMKIALVFDGQKLKASQANVEKEAEKSVSKVEKIAGKVGTAVGVGVAAAVTTSAAAVVKITKDAFEAYGAYEQLAGGVETLFKDASDQVIANANNAFKTAQMSANEYMNTVTSFSASLLQSLGGDTQKAAKYADQAVIDMADNANKMGTSMDAIQNAYQGFAKQNYTMLDNLKLGYGGTKTEMERLLKDAEKISGVKYDISSFADITQAIHVVQKEMGIMGTSAKEGSKTVQGSIATMKGAWGNFLTALGDPNGNIDQAMDDLLNSFNAVIDNVVPLLGRILNKIVEALPNVVTAITQKLPELIRMLVPVLITAAVQIAFELIRNLPAIVMAIIEGLVQAFSDLLGPVGENIMQFFKGMWEGIVLGAQMAWEGIKNAFGAVASWFGSVFKAAWEGVKAVFSTGGKIFAGIVDGIVKAFKAVVNAIIRGLNGVIAIPFNAINGILQGIHNIDILGAHPFEWVGTISVPQIPLLAQGGYADGASQAVIGEAGKEVVLPLENNTDNWSGLLASALAEKFNEEDKVGGGITIENQNFNISSQLDAENIGHIMMQSIRRQAR